MVVNVIIYVGIIADVRARVRCGEQAANVCAWVGWWVWVGVQKFLNVHVQLCFMVREIPLVCKMSQVLWSRPGMPCVTSVHSLTPTLPSPEKHSDMQQGDSVG